MFFLKKYFSLETAPTPFPYKFFMSMDILMNNTKTRKICTCESLAILANSPKKQCRNSVLGPPNLMASSSCASRVVNVTSCKLLASANFLPLKWGAAISQTDNLFRTMFRATNMLTDMIFYVFDELLFRDFLRQGRTWLLVIIFMLLKTFLDSFIDCF